MIFRQWELVISGRKTQTRRIWHDGDYTWMCGRRGAHPAPLLYSQICMANGRTRYKVGQKLPVVPKYQKPMIWIDPHGNPRLDAITYVHDTEYDLDTRIDRSDLWAEHGFKPARVEILSLWREPVQNISPADAIAEGVNSVEEYRDLWESINGKTRLYRWAENPLVTVIEFDRAWVTAA